MNKLINLLLVALLFLLINPSIANKSISSYNTSQLKKHKTQSKSKSKKIRHKKTKNYMQGLASYYGVNDGFDGQQMANGEKFNTHDISTAAHPTLPLGTTLKVTNLTNGRSIYVKIKDRMPKKYNRVIDLSSSGARFLGMYKKGICKVKLEKISLAKFKENQFNLEVGPNDEGQPN